LRPCLTLSPDQRRDRNQHLVPASLERRGSVRGFWVSRVFRLYPFYPFALSAMIVLWASGIGSLLAANDLAIR
jgi:peptidoglycan/LPS O-acetylase OafA/YrhL